MLTFGPRNKDDSNDQLPTLGAAMSEVIRFQPAKEPRRSAPENRAAEILFFTGVRYQRMSEDEPAPQPQPSYAAQQHEGGGGDRTRRR